MDARIGPPKEITQSRGRKFDEKKERLPISRWTFDEGKRRI